MDIIVIKAEDKHLVDCEKALQNSELGKVYFSDEEKAINAIKEGIAKEEISIVLNQERLVLGFVWIIPYGAFHSFPYLHMIVIKEEFRNQGIGKKVLRHFENILSENSSKIFLVVADFNPKAKKFYKSIGYKEIGDIPNLYKEDVTECLMMKEL